MMRLVIIFLLASITSFGQLINNNMMLTAGRDSVATPYPFFANSITVDSINVTWIDIGADTYVLESANNKTFSSGLTTEYSGSGTSFDLPGLSANTKKYFRLHAETAGFANSEYVIDSATTFPFTPIGYYDFKGLADTTNKYADNNTVVTYNYIKSVINPSGPTLTSVSTLGSITTNFLNWTTTPRYAHNQLHTPSSNFVFSGDFEVNWRIIFNTAPNNSSILFNSANTQRIRMVSLSSVQFGTNSAITLTNPLELGKIYWVTFQRSGTTFTIIVRDNEGNITSNSGTVAGTSVTFDRVFFASTIFRSQCLFLMGRVLTSDERLAGQDLIHRPTFVPKANDPSTVVKANWNSFTPYYLVNSDFANNITTTNLRDRYFGFGPYQFALTHKKFGSPLYSADLLYVFKNNNEVSDPVDYGYPSTSDDVHMTGSIALWNNMIVHMKMDYHYDDGIIENLVITMSGADMNMLAKKVITLGKGIPRYTASSLQYLQSCIINGKIYITAQEYSGGTGGNLSRRIVLLISDNEWSSFRKYQIIELDDGDGDFLYHNMIFSEDKILLTVEHQELPGNYHKAVYAIVCDPAVSETTFGSIDGTFTRNLTTGPITMTQANASLVMGTAFQATASATNSVKQSWGLYNPQTDSALVVRINGTDDGLTLDVLDIGAGAITEEAIPGTIDGHSLWLDTSGSGSDNQFFAYEDGSDIYLVANEYNSGNIIINRFIRTGTGTWAFVDKISQDDTKPHIRLAPTKNWHYTENRSIFATKYLTTTSDLFIYNISTP